MEPASVSERFLGSPLIKHIWPEALSNPDASPSSPFVRRGTFRKRLEATSSLSSIFFYAVRGCACPFWKCWAATNCGLPSRSELRARQNRRHWKLCRTSLPARWRSAI